jgi:hypothetical protein
MTITTNLCLAGGFLVALGAGDLSATSTAWQNGRFRLDVPGVPHRSDIFLSRPPTLRLQKRWPSPWRCGLGG